MNDRYETPLASRYASEKMQFLFSAQHRVATWRKLWVVLAKAEKELGLAISNDQIAQMEAAIHTIDFAYAAKKEQELRHDVMAHIHTFGHQCPLAKPIIHLGATSAYVVDNADLIIYKEALQQIEELLITLIQQMADFADHYATTPLLGYTHFQAAQPTTLGKRASLWLQDFVMDAEEIQHRLQSLRLLGCRGATGTSASFLALFQQDAKKVKALEEMIVAAFDFPSAYSVSGQTYTRKVDALLVQCLSNIAQSAYKFSNDIRLMMHLQEVEEPYETKQVGSSAMAYKQNPMRSERIAALSRFVMVDALNPVLTASSQWLERTLDDSANKRIAIPEAFLATDAILRLVINVVQGLKVYPKVMKKHIQKEWIYLLTENILMAEVKQGGDRQKAHDVIKEHTFAVRQLEKEGKTGLSLEKRLIQDSRLFINKVALEKMKKESNLIGLAAKQTKTYVKAVQKTYGKLAEKVDVQIKV